MKAYDIAKLIAELTRYITVYYFVACFGHLT